MAPTHVFSDVGSYVAHWASILYDISRSESKENSSRTKDDLTISWVEGLQGPVAITSFNEGDKEDLRLGAAVYLERDAVVTVEDCIFRAHARQNNTAQVVLVLITFCCPKACQTDLGKAHVAQVILAPTTLHSRRACHTDLGGPCCSSRTGDNRPVLSESMPH